MIRQNLFNQLNINLRPYQKTFMNLVEQNPDDKDVFFLQAGRGMGKTYYLIAEAINQSFLLHKRVMFVTHPSQAVSHTFREIQSLVNHGGLAHKNVGNEIIFYAAGTTGSGVKAQGSIEVIGVHSLQHHTHRGHHRIDVLLYDEFGDNDEKMSSAFDLLIALADTKILTTTYMNERANEIWNDLQFNKMKIPEEITFDIPEDQMVKKIKELNVVTDISYERMAESIVKSSGELDRPVAMSEVWTSQFTIGIDVATGEDHTAVFTGFATTNAPIFFHDGIETRFSPSSNNPSAHALIYGMGD